MECAREEQVELQASKLEIAKEAELSPTAALAVKLLVAAVYTISATKAS